MHSCTTHYFASFLHLCYSCLNTFLLKNDQEKIPWRSSSELNLSSPHESFQHIIRQLYSETTVEIEFCLVKLQWVKWPETILDIPNKLISTHEMIYEDLQVRLSI